MGHLGLDQNRIFNLVWPYNVSHAKISWTGKGLHPDNYTLKLWTICLVGRTLLVKYLKSSFRNTIQRVEFLKANRFLKATGSNRILKKNFIHYLNLLKKVKHFNHFIIVQQN